MEEISLFEAKTHFSSLIERVFKQHEEIIITKRGERVAKITPYESVREADVLITINALEKFSKKVGKIGLTLKMIKKMKEEGRR